MGHSNDEGPAMFHPPRELAGWLRAVPRPVSLSPQLAGLGGIPAAWRPGTGTHGSRDNPREGPDQLRSCCQQISDTCSVCLACALVRAGAWCQQRRELISNPSPSYWK